MNQFESEFQKQNDRLYSEIIRFYSQVKLFILLLRKKNENSHAFRILHHFFRIIEWSLIYGILLDVNRLLLDKRSNTLINFVSYARDHSGLFSIELLKERFNRKGSEFKENTNWLPPTKSDFDNLLAHLEYLRSKFDYLKGFRNKYLTHFSSDYAKGAYNAATRINPEDLDSLAEDMWSAYFKVSCWYSCSVHLTSRIESKLQKELNIIISNIVRIPQTRG